MRRTFADSSADQRSLSNLCCDGVAARRPPVRCPGVRRAQPMTQPTAQTSARTAHTIDKTSTLEGRGPGSPRCRCHNADRAVVLNPRSRGHRGSKSSRGQRGEPTADSEVVVVTVSSSEGSPSRAQGLRRTPCRRSEICPHTRSSTCCASSSPHQKSSERCLART